MGCGFRYNGEEQLATSSFSSPSASKKFKASATPPASTGVSMSAQGASLQFATPMHKALNGAPSSASWAPGKNYKLGQQPPDMTQLMMAAAAQEALDNGASDDEAVEAAKNAVLLGSNPRAMHLTSMDTGGMSAEEIAMLYKPPARGLFSSLPNPFTSLF